MTFAAAGRALAKSIQKHQALQRERLISIYEVDACAICDAIGVMNRCAWPVEKETDVPFADMQMGDAVRVEPGPYGFRYVRTLRRSFDGKVLYYGLQGSGNTFVVNIDPAAGFNATFRGHRIAACGAACCDACTRSVDDNRHYCRDHWNSWEQVH